MNRALWQVTKVAVLVALSLGVVRGQSGVFPPPAGGGGGSSGDVVGPGSATDNGVPTFDTTTGKLIQDSGCTIVSGVLTCTPTGAGIEGTPIANASVTAPVTVGDWRSFWDASNGDILSDKKSDGTLRRYVRSTETTSLDFSGAQTKTHQSGTSLPGTCGVGESYQKTDATAASQWYLCTSTNTWTAQGGSGGATCFQDRDIQVNDGVNGRLGVTTNNYTMATVAGSGATAWAGGLSPEADNTKGFTFRFAGNACWAAKSAATVKVFLTANATPTGNVVYTAALQTLSSNSALTAAYGTAASSSATTLQTQGNLTMVSITVDLSACSAGTLCSVNVLRDTADSSVEDVYVLRGYLE